MARRRILIINNRVPYPLHDGGNIAVNEMVKTYHRSGLEVCLLAMNTSRHYVDTTQVPHVYREIRFETVDIDNSVKPIAVLQNLLFSNKPNHAERFFDRAFSEKLQEMIANFKPDIIQVESIYLTEYLPDIKAYAKALLVLRLHNIEYQVWQRLANATRNPVRRWYLRNLVSRLEKYERDAWKAYDLVLPITSTDAIEVEQYVPKSSMLVTPVGIDFDFKKSNTGDEWVGYHIGAMDWAPNAEGIEWFIKVALPEIWNVFPDFRFYFAGRNMPATFTRFSGPNIICAGEVPDAKEFIKGKKILFVPIHAGGGIRVKVLEAMALEKVIISTDVGMQGIGAIPGTHYLSANTADEFARATHWVMSHIREAAEMGKNAAGFVQKHYSKTTIDTDLINRLNAMLG